MPSSGNIDVYIERLKILISSRGFKESNGLDKSIYIGTMNSVLVSNNVYLPSKTGVPVGAQIDEHKSVYLENVVNLCLRTNIYEKLGLNFYDLVSMPIPLFHELRDMIQTHDPQEQKIIKELLRDYKGSLGK